MERSVNTNAKRNDNIDKEDTQFKYFQTKPTKEDTDNNNVACTNGCDLYSIRKT